MKFDKILMLKLVFCDGGMVMVVNVLLILDGVVVFVMMCCLEVECFGFMLKVVIVGYLIYVDKFGLFVIVLIGVLCKLLEKIGWNLCDVDLFEINEVFVVVLMVVMCDFDLLYEKVNVYGGVCVFGYLIGVLGVCVMVMLLVVFEMYGLKCGVVLLCIGGGEVMVVVIECFV